MRAGRAHHVDNFRSCLAIELFSIGKVATEHELPGELFGLAGAPVQDAGDLHAGHLL
jgi:hypothetical protein